MKIDYRDIIIVNNIEYIKISIGNKYLNISKYAFDISIKNEKIERIKIGKESFIEVSALYNLLEKQKKFLETHIAYKLAIKKYKKHIYKELKKFNIPFYARIDNSELAYSLIEISEVIKSENEKWKDYIPRKEAIRLLGLGDYNFKKTIQKFGIKQERVGREWMCLREDIEFLKEQQKELGIRYISYNQLIDIYGTTVYKNIKSYELPIFARRTDIFPELSATYYDRVEAEEYVLKRAKNKSYYDAKEDTLYNTYKKKIEIITEFKCIIELEYTYYKWLDYVYNVLSKTSKNEIGQAKLLNSLVKVVEELDNYLYENDKQEIYELSTSKLIHLMNILKSQSLYKAELFYGFLNLISKDSELKIKVSKERKKIFNIKDIPNYSTIAIKNRKKNVKNEIYDLNQYKDLFNFINDTEYHIKQYFNNCLSVKEKGIYLSNWLYLILHLNNAWRNGDINKFPRLNFDSLELNFGIDNIEWFKTNCVSQDLSRQIIAIINSYEFKVNKTKVDAHFFCSNQLMNTLATVLLMLDLHIKHEYIGEEKEFNKSVMLFYTKYNTASKYKINSFLKPVNIENFQFSSLKMNKTILTFIYELSDEKGSLLLSKYLRSHTNEESTLHYVNIDKKDIDFLVEQLFQRGEFGYIYDVLLEIIDKKSVKSIEEKTKNILQIKKHFGNELKIEATLGMLNYFSDERKEVLEILTNRGYDECINLLSDIYMNKLPSRDRDIQCLFSKEGCVCIHVKNCVDCKFSIPSIYALNIICDSIKNDFKYYNNTQNIPQRIKTSLRLMKKKQLLKEAIKRYGKEYIYSILEMTNYEFLDTFSRILPPEELAYKLKGDYIK